MSLWVIWVYDLLKIKLHRERSCCLNRKCKLNKKLYIINCLLRCWCSLYIAYQDGCWWTICLHQISYAEFAGIPAASVTKSYFPLYCLSHYTSNASTMHPWPYRNAVNLLMLLVLGKGLYAPWCVLMVWFDPRKCVQTKDRLLVCIRCWTNCIRHGIESRVVGSKR